METAIEVCKDSGQIESALELAEKTNHIDQYLRILVENKKQEDFKKALTKIREIPDSEQYREKLEYIRQYGSILLKHLTETTYMMIKSFTQYVLDHYNRHQAVRERFDEQSLKKPQWSDIKYLEGIFVDNQKLHKDFLEYVKTMDPNCAKDVYHSLLELMLLDYYNYMKKNEKFLKSRITEDHNVAEMEEQIMIFINVNREKYDKKHVLMLFQMYQFSEGIKELCLLLELKQELMAYYMDKKEYNNIMKICNDYGKKVPYIYIYIYRYIYIGRQSMDTSSDIFYERVTKF